MSLRQKCNTMFSCFSHRAESRIWTLCVRLRILPKLIWFIGVEINFLTHIQGPSQPWSNNKVISYVTYRLQVPVVKEATNTCMRVDYLQHTPWSASLRIMRALYSKVTLFCISRAEPKLLLYILPMFRSYFIGHI